MRKYGYLLFDMFGILLMLVAALYLRNGVPLIEDGKPGDLFLLLANGALVSLLVLPVMKIHTRMWRYTAAPDLWAIVIAASMIVLLINSGLFLFNRLEVVPRSVPPMHWALMIVFMAGIRLLVRALIGPKTSDNNPRNAQHVLLVGTGQVAELYVAFATKVIPGLSSIEGVVDEDTSLRDRSFHQYPVYGTPDCLPDLLERLLVHGIHINKLIITKPLERYKPETQQVLLQLESEGHVELVHFEQQIGLYRAEDAQTDRPKPAHHTPYDQIVFEEPQGFYPKLKRGFDLVGSIALLLLLSPIIALTALLVYLDVGPPLLFWQKRPGRFGKPFRLYKFRTMKPSGRKRSEHRLAHKTGDANRTSAVGRWIRRLRLDELPQLYHILEGTMSFIGPRPLLPEDQPEGGEQRLSVRPGVTGWAQVNGGDALTSGQKRVLDLWYIQNMSLLLDIRILLRTLVVIFQEDTPQREAVDLAARDLRKRDEAA